MSADELDPLGDLLGRRDSGPPDETLRERALAQTLPVLRRRRVARRAGWALAFAGCYLAGMATMNVWQRGDGGQLVVGQKPSAPAAPKRQTPRGTRLVEGQQPAEREKTPFELLRDAGDEAWQRRGDLESAIRLYAQAIEVATPAELKISAADDNWLMMALKQDHVEENEHVDDTERGDADRS